MASKKKSKKKDSQPKVPEAQAVPALTAPSEAEAQKYEPMSLNDFSNWMNKAYDIQLQRFPEVLDTQKQAQDVLYRNMGALQREQAYYGTSTANQLLEAYNPEFRQAYAQQMSNLAAQRRDVGLLGKNVTEDLASKYDLGPGLSREMEQSIRGAQTARGNIMGAAPTAQEAFGKGQASIDLYNNRLSQYNQYLGQQQNMTGAQQNFLQGRNPTDLMGQMAGSFMSSTYYPSQSYVDTGLGAQSMSDVGSQQSAYNATAMSGYSTFQNALQNYNQNQISATTATNEGIYNQYDRTAEAWQYREAVRRGLYSTPQVGGGGAGQIAGSVVSGVGAAAGGVAAAASAAGAAICWLARAVIPERWQDFQRYLFTRAPEKLRRFYIYNAQRLSREVSDAEAAEIGELMLCLL